MMRLKSALLILIMTVVFSNLLAQDTPQNIYHERFKINTDTTLVSDGTKIHFKFISKEKYLSELSIYRDSMLSDSLCDGITDYEKCKSLRASHLLFKFKDRFTTADSCIIFHLQKGDSLILCDRVCNCEASARYELENYLTGFNLFSVSAGYWESGGYILVNPITGEQTHIWNEPLPSPHKNRILTHSYDAEMGYAFNGLQMWKKVDNSIKIEWVILFKEWGPSEVFWADDGNIYLKAKTHYFIKNAPEHRYLEINIEG